MIYNTLFILLFLCCSSNYTHGQSTEADTNAGYYAIPSVEGLFKFHQENTNWKDAKTVCANEGSVLFHPLNENEATTVIPFMKILQPSTVLPLIIYPQYIWLGAHRIGDVFKTIDGHTPYLNLSSVDPDSNNYNKSCVLMETTYNNSIMSVVPCDFGTLRFICRRQTDEWYKENNKQILDGQSSEPDSQYPKTEKTAAWINTTSEQLPANTTDMEASGGGQSSDPDSQYTDTEKTNPWILTTTEQFYNDTTDVTASQGFKNQIGGTYWNSRATVHSGKIFDVRRGQGLKNNIRGHPMRDGQSTVADTNAGYYAIPSVEGLFKYHGELKNWEDAKTICANEGSVLFHPLNEQEAKAVVSFLSISGNIWLGAHRTAGDQFKIIDGYLPYWNWHEGEPNNVGNDENCVAMAKDDNKMNDVPCRGTISFICRRQPDKWNNKNQSQILDGQSTVADTDAGYYPIPSVEGLFKYHGEHQNWEDAKTICANEGSVLFHPLNEQEAKAVVSFLAIFGNIWLGAHRTGDQFKIIDGYLPYWNWRKGEPNNAGNDENCVAMYTKDDNKMNDVPCRGTISYICRRQPDEWNNKSHSQILDGQSTVADTDAGYYAIPSVEGLFKYHGEHKNWEDAKTICENEGSVLFHPLNEQEAKDVVSFLAIFGNIWLGAQRTGDQFKIIDGYVPYWNWRKGEPNNADNDENCVAMYANNDNKMNDVPCRGTISFICRRQPDEWNNKSQSQILDEQSTVADTDAGYYAIPSVEGLFKYHGDHKNWEDAKTICANEGSVLFHPLNEQEAKAVVSFLAIFGNIWLGAHRTAGDQFKIIDGYLPYWNWRKGEPNNVGNDEKCVAMSAKDNNKMNDVPCRETISFICRRQTDEWNNKNQSQILDEQSTEADPNAGYYAIPSVEGLFKYHDEHKNWEDAKTICANEGSILFHPLNEQEAKDVVSFLAISENIWLGAHRTGDQFKIIDGYLPYWNWREGEPNNVGNDENCVAMYAKDDNKMNVVPCSGTISFICKRQTDEWNNKCQSRILGYGYAEEVGKCYKFHLTPKTWTEAQDKCQAENSDLAVINSHEEAAYLVRLTNSIPKIRIPGCFKHGIVLLGFHKINVEDWQTIEGTTLYNSGYACWGNSQPDGDDSQLCGSMYYNGYLNDIECDQKAFFICEQNIDPQYYAYEPAPQFPAQQSLKCRDEI